MKPISLKALIPMKVLQKIARETLFSTIAFTLICATWCITISVYATCKGTGTCDQTCSNARYSTKYSACKTTGAIGGKCKHGSLADPDDNCDTCKCLPKAVEEDSACSCKESQETN